MRNKEITVLHSAKTGEWVDIKKELHMKETIKEVLQKLQWLKNIIVECQSMDKYHKMDNKALFPAWSEVEDLITCFSNDYGYEKYDTLKVSLGLVKCNEILKALKIDYKFSIDWRGNMEGDLYTQYILNKA